MKINEGSRRKDTTLYGRVWGSLLRLLGVTERYEGFGTTLLIPVMMIYLAYKN